jgi:hypothetical protein
MSTQETHTHKPSLDAQRTGGLTTLEGDGLGPYPARREAAAAVVGWLVWSRRL